MTYTQQLVRTLTTKKGLAVTTPLSDREAMMLLAQDESEFAQKLYNTYLAKPLSDDQIVWAHKLVVDAGRQRYNESIKPVPVKPIKNKITGQYTSIVEMFAQAKKHLKYPKLKIRLDASQVIELKLSGLQSKYCGQIQITDGGKFGDNQWYGRITAEGVFSAANNCPDWVMGALSEFAANPQFISANYGQITGECCFCYRELTDSRSLNVGYGAICADHYGLPWGD